MYTKDQITSAIWEELKEAQHTGDNNDRVYEVIGIVTAAFERIKKPSLPPLPEPILTDEDVKDWEGEKKCTCSEPYDSEKHEGGYPRCPVHDKQITPEWGSVRMIGRVKERFKELEEKQHDWRSFYCAWLEGRVDMLQQIKGYGRLSQDRADLIREANNRDLDGVAGTISQDAHEKEVMMQAFNKVRQIFEGRQWIVEGRGGYPYNDDRYKEEVRYMYDEFDKLFKDTWGNIQSKSFEYRKAIIAEYVKGTTAGREEDAVAFGEWLRTFDLLDKQYGHWVLESQVTTAKLYEFFKQQKEK